MSRIKMVKKYKNYTTKNKNINIIKINENSYIYWKKDKLKKYQKTIQKIRVMV